MEDRERFMAFYEREREGVMVFVARRQSVTNVIHPNSVAGGP
jgi:hypothetical protein